MAIAALVLGIIGIVGAWIPFVSYIAIFMSIAAIVLGVKARKDLRATGQPLGMATAGMVLGIVGVAVNVALIVCGLCIAGTLLAAYG